MYYICKSCKGQFVRNIQPCPDCGKSDGFSEVVPKGAVIINKESKANFIPKKKKK